MSLQQLLDQGLAQLGLTLDAAACQRLLDFIALLVKWNKTYNLTAIRDPQQMVPRHLLDSLAVSPWLHGQRVIDVGSGAGVPGIPLAIADASLNPQREYVLLDSNSKKTRFITQVTGELALTNVEVVTARAEEYHPPQVFDSVVTRAFAGVEKTLNQSRHLCAPDGRFLLMKGDSVDQELSALPPEFVLQQRLELKVPMLEAQRYLLIISGQ